MSSADFANDPLLNAAAAYVASSLQIAVEGSPGFAGLQITSSGIELDYVGTPTAAVKSAIEAASAASRPLLTGTANAAADGVIPIYIRNVAHTEAELLALTNRILVDASDWTAQGVTMSSWGPDIVSNTVRVHLSDYSPGAAVAIEAKYGPAVSVAPGSEAVAVRYNGSLP